MTKKITKLMLNGEEYEIREYQEGGGGWQPGPNTLLYLPLATDAIDQSGNNRSTSWYGTSSFTTVGNVPSANFSNGKIGVSNDFIDTSLTEKTISCWVYPTFSSVNSDNTFLYWLSTDNCFFALTFVSSSKIDSWTGDHGNLTTADLGYSQNQWMLVTTTCKDGADNNKVYINGNLVIQGQGTNRPRGYSSATFNLGTFIGGTHNTYAGNINISNVILEDKARTDQEVLDYYNATKDNYSSSTPEPEPEPQTETCHRCGGTGEEDCNMCGGVGQEMCTTCQGTGQVGDPEDPESRTVCPDCDGGGFISCGNCGGTGKVTCEWCGGTGEEPGE